MNSSKRSDYVKTNKVNFSLASSDQRSKFYAIISLAIDMKPKRLQHGFANVHENAS